MKCEALICLVLAGCSASRRVETFRSTGIKSLGGGQDPPTDETEFVSPPASVGENHAFGGGFDIPATPEEWEEWDEGDESEIEESPIEGDPEMSDDNADPTDSMEPQGQSPENSPEGEVAKDEDAEVNTPDDVNPENLETDSPPKTEEQSPEDVVDSTEESPEKSSDVEPPVQSPEKSPEGEVSNEEDAEVNTPEDVNPENLETDSPPKTEEQSPDAVVDSTEELPEKSPDVEPPAQSPEKSPEGAATKDEATQTEPETAQDDGTPENLEPEKAPDSPARPKGKKITVEGFPDEINGVWRGSLNGVYYQDVKGDYCNQGHPTYWQEESENGDTPFIYYCGKNSTTKRTHRKWAISSKRAWEKMAAGACDTFAPFPPRKELSAGLAVSMLYKGWVDGVDQGWTDKKNPTDQELVSKVKIASIEDMDEEVENDCTKS
jgi:hypothetical protein